MLLFSFLLSLFVTNSNPCKMIEKPKTKTERRGSREQRWRGGDPLSLSLNDTKPQLSWCCSENHWVWHLIAIAGKTLSLSLAFLLLFPSLCSSLGKQLKYFDYMRQKSVPGKSKVIPIYFFAPFFSTNLDFGN